MRLPLIATFVAIAALAAGQAAAMTFEKVTGPAECAARTCVVASGYIDEHTADDFQRFAEANALGDGALVALDSRGGNVIQSLKLGGQFRKLGAPTTVRSYDREHGAFAIGGVCASACVYAFLGGVDRSVPPVARLGVHQVDAPKDQPLTLSASDGQWLMSLVAVHFSRMGAKLDLLTLALRTRPSEMRWLSDEELVRFAVVTGAAAS